MEDGDGVVGSSGGGLGFPAYDAGEPGAAHVEAEVPVVGAHILAVDLGYAVQGGRVQGYVVGCVEAGGVCAEDGDGARQVDSLDPVGQGSFEDVEVAGEVDGVCEGSVGLGEYGIGGS